MTRFDATQPTDRRKLFADAVRAHRERASPFLTVEVARDDDTTDPFGDAATDTENAGTDTENAGTDTDGAETAESDTTDAETDDDTEHPPPWIQFADDTFNLDCTETEYDRLTTVLDDYPEFRIDELTEPEEAEGKNVRITARSDANRLAGFMERTFREVYDCPESYRAWVTEI